MQKSFFDDDGNGSLRINPALLVEVLAEPDTVPEARTLPVTIPGKKMLTALQLEAWRSIAFEYHSLTFRGLHIPLSSDKLFSVRGRGCPMLREMRGLERAGLIEIGMVTPETIDYRITSRGFTVLPSMEALRRIEEEAAAHLPQAVF